MSRECRRIAKRRSISRSSSSASEKGKERAVPTSAEQDLAVVRLLQEMILPRLSSSDVPHQIIGDFARCFQQASVLWIYRERSRWDFATCAPRPTVAPADRLAGESIRLRCLDLLFAGSNGRQEDPRVRDAFGAALESRARSSLTSMLADLRIRGSMPFERIREMDMLLLLQRIEHEPRRELEKSTGRACLNLRSSTDAGYSLSALDVAPATAPRARGHAPSFSTAVALLGAGPNPARTLCSHDTHDTGRHRPRFGRFGFAS